MDISDTTNATDANMDMISQVDFFNMMNDDVELNGEQSTDMCGLTHESCMNPITLECGHTFEYTALVTELVNRRLVNKLNRYAQRIDRSTTNGFKCPYCRSIQTNTLPYFRMEGVALSAGITSPAKRQMEYPHHCSVPCKSGKNKGSPCGKIAFFHTGDAIQRYCAKHGVEVADTKEAIRCSGVMIRGKNVPEGMRQICRATNGINEMPSHPGIKLCGTHRRTFGKRGTIDIFTNNSVLSDNCVTISNVESLSWVV